MNRITLELRGRIYSQPRAARRVVMRAGKPLPLAFYSEGYKKYLADLRFVGDRVAAAAGWDSSVPQIVHIELRTHRLNYDLDKAAAAVLDALSADPRKKAIAKAEKAGKPPPPLGNPWWDDDSARYIRTLWVSHHPAPSGHDNECVRVVAIAVDV